MPAETGYNSQVGPAPASSLPRADPTAFGAGIGAGIEAIGNSLHRADMTNMSIERQQRADSEAASFNARFAQLREAADKASVDARNNAAPGGVGHADQMRQWLDENSKSLLDGITDRRVQRSAQAQIAEFGSRFNSSEYQWQEGRRVGKIVTDQGNVIDAAANRAERLVDPKAFGEELSFYHQGVMSLEGTPADVKAKLIHEGEQAITGGFANGMLRRDPEALKRVLDSGEFDSMLSKEQMQHLRSGIDVEIRRRDAATKAQSALQLHLEKEALQTDRAKLETGAGTPQDWETLAQRYDAIGDNSSAVTARAQGAGMAAAIGHRGDSLPQLDQQIASLTAIRNNGTGLTPHEASTLTGLTALRGQLAGMLGQPGGAMLALQFATGKPVAPINPADPSSMRMRTAYAKAAAAQYGRPTADPLLPTELPTFRDLMTGGPSQKMEALQLIQGFGDPQVIRAAAAQIAGPGNAPFRIASQLAPSIAREVLQGEETLKSAPQVWNEARASADFNKWYGPMLRWIPGSYRDDVFKAAKAFYGQRAVNGGEQAYNPGRFAEAIETVLGRMPEPNGATGGIARTKSGIVLVPQGVKPDDLLTRFRRASAEDYARASGGGVPIWSDKTPLTRTELVNLLPTAIGNGRYGFRGPNGQLVHDKRGGDYVVDFNGLAQ
ncbi:hypothetical protein [Sphingomonas sp.]|uniref:hypothetical protein n=1 Tax=Sphingomonas sp. TaxID=28214 RepID=UPI00257D5F68|nr:hypothetical protein [Sphingomonas sp.]